MKLSHNERRLMSALSPAPSRYVGGFRGKSTPDSEPRRTVNVRMSDDEMRAAETYCDARGVPGVSTGIRCALMEWERLTTALDVLIESLKIKGSCSSEIIALAEDALAGGRKQ